MPGTYTQLYIHGVFAVQYRQALIQPSWQPLLHRYITGIVQSNGHKLLAINSMPDHLHFFVGLQPAQSLSELMRQVKGDSSEWVNKQRLTGRKFHWQEGYGAFSNSRSQIDAVVGYIHNQQQHHRKTSFGEEYRRILKAYGIAFQEPYLFKEPAD